MIRDSSAWVNVETHSIEGMRQERWVATCPQQISVLENTQFRYQSDTDTHAPFLKEATSNAGGMATYTGGSSYGSADCTPDSMGDNLPLVDLGIGKEAMAAHARNGSTCALLVDGSVKCWGMNTAGQLGLGNTISHGGGFPGGMGDLLDPVALGTGKSATQIALGFSTRARLSTTARSNVGAAISTGSSDSVTSIIVVMALRKWAIN
jgi:hypothetical protein